MAKKIILDMDPGIDDAMALMAACVSESVQILGVTVVAGNLPLDITSANASGILNFMNSPVSVYPGAGGPLYRKLKDAAAFHGPNGLGNWRADPNPQRVSSKHAAAFMAEMAAANPGQVTLVATGPLTNLAIALEYHPREMAELAGIVFMGGALTVPGNVTPVAEYNIYADPDAAEVVLNSGLNLLMVGLDVTLTVRLIADDLKLLSSAGPTAQAVAAMVQYYFERYGDIPLHDPLALLAAMEPQLFELQYLPIKIETRGELTRGQTIADFSGRQNWEKNLKAAMAVNKAQAKTLLMELWTR
jgi:inosine-uridine nucleoside N-ribohydrolase